MYISKKGEFNQTIVLEEQFRAPREKVFKAWTQAESLRKWFMADDGVVVTDAFVDLRYEGPYFIEVLFPGNQPSRIDGQFLRVDINEELQYTWIVPLLKGRKTMVNVSFMEHEMGSMIILEHGEFEDENELQLHLEGWKGCIGKLHDFLASN